MPKPSWEDMSVFFNSDEFAIEAIVTTNDGTITIKGIYDDALYIRDIGEADFEQTKPRFVCDTEMTTGIKRDMPISIDGKDAHIIDIIPDGTGLSTIYMS